MINNLSFIIIARNEAFALKKCLDSIAAMELHDCEVICVDSDSTDDTLEVMQDFADKIEYLKIIHISGFINAAVARNAGMKYATKKYIFYIDGDIELYPDFIDHAVKRIESGVADAVTGKLKEIQYSPDYKKEIRQLVRRKQMTTEKTCIMTGGIFIVSRQMVDKVGEWDERFVRNQDLEYTLRISRYGRLLQIPEFIGIHHTQEYFDRSWEQYKKCYPMLFGKLLLRSLNSPRLAFAVLRRNRGLLTFLGLLGFALICFVGVWLSLWNINLTIIGVCVMFLADFIYSTILKKYTLLQWILHNYLTPPLILLGIFYQRKSNCKQETIIKEIKNRKTFTTETRR